MATKRTLEAMARSISPPATAAKKKLKSATTKSAVLNFFEPASQKVPAPTTWRVAGRSLLVGRYRNREGKAEGEKKEKTRRTKIAGFDLDGTLIVTRSGNRHAKTESDWKWWNECVPGKLRQLYEEGYQVIIFTNQGGIRAPGKDTINLRRFKLKAALILDALDLPVSIYAATENDAFRKPRVGMWEEMKDDYDLDVHGVDLEHSYLVGDAAGRKGDFADSDRHWSMNVGIAFHTPEEFFLGQKGMDMFHRFDHSSHLEKHDEVDAGSLFKVSEAPQEIVVFVGSPGAGKSTFYRRYLEPLQYERVNQDALKTKYKCIKVAQGLLQQGKSVAIDNTNADIATRAQWVSLARKCNVPIRCIHFTSPADLCQHNDAVRAFGGKLVNPEGRTVLPNVAFTSYASRFSKPQRSEGFDADVMSVAFQWSGTEAEREIWGRYWI